MPPSGRPVRPDATACSDRDSDDGGDGGGHGPRHGEQVERVRRVGNSPCAARATPATRGLPAASLARSAALRPLFVAVRGNRWVELHGGIGGVVGRAGVAAGRSSSRHRSCGHRVSLGQQVARRDRRGDGWAIGVRSAGEPGVGQSRRSPGSLGEAQHHGSALLRWQLGTQTRQTASHRRLRRARGPGGPALPAPATTTRRLPEAAPRKRYGRWRWPAARPLSASPR